jgi:MFS family permease
MVTIFYPVLIVSKGFSKGNVSEIALWATLLLILFKPRLGKISDKLGYEKPIIGTMLISGIILIIMVYIPSSLFFHVILFTVLIGSFITAYTAVNGGTAKKAPASQRGLALGALGFYVSTGRTTSTVVLGFIWDVYDINMVFLVAGITVIIITLGVYMASSFFKKTHKTIE